MISLLPALAAIGAAIGWLGHDWATRPVLVRVRRVSAGRQLAGGVCAGVVTMAALGVSYAIWRRPSSLALAAIVGLRVAWLTLASVRALLIRQR